MKMFFKIWSIMVVYNLGPDVISAQKGRGRGTTTPSSTRGLGSRNAADARKGHGRGTTASARGRGLPISGRGKGLKSPKVAVDESNPVEILDLITPPQLKRRKIPFEDAEFLEIPDSEIFSTDYKMMEECKCYEK